MSHLAERLQAVETRIQRAAAQAGRSRQGIVLVGVSKRQTVDAIREAYAAGMRDFGENYISELKQKAEVLQDLSELRWHVIGHLQRNKAKTVVRVASLVHTVDSTRIAEELGRRRDELGGAADPDRAQRLPVLLEVNVSGEDQKSGCRPDQIGPVLNAVDQQPALWARGLMTVPPYSEDPAQSREYFEELHRLRDVHGGASRLPELSMGMSHDFEQAILAGATLVRVGTAIFGERAPRIEP